MLKRLCLTAAILSAAGYVYANHVAAPHDHCASAAVQPVGPNEVAVFCEPLNRAPLAVDDTLSGLSLEAIEGNVLTNDTDPDNDQLEVVQPNNIAPDGSFSDTFSVPGVYTFTYEASDGQLTDQGTLTVTVNNRAPTAVADTNSVQSGFDATGNVLSNDNDPDGGSLTVTSGNGINPDGSYSISQGTPGEVVIPYEIADGQGGTSSSTLTITFTNQLPVAVDDSASGQTNTNITGNVLGNDSDPDEGTLTVTNSTGAFSIDPNGSWTFNSPTSGVFTVDYTVSDGQGGTANATLTVTVSPPANQPPTAFDDSNSGQVSQAITGNVLTNDTDPDAGQTLSVVPPSASIIQPDGSYSFTEATPGTYSFDYTVSDGNGGTDTATLTITVTSSGQQTLSFPGADGAGRFSIGGRGGSVIQVTNLNDSGTGSLRACVEASGPRTCVFRVSGNIGLDTPIEVTSPFLTIAGETAPGQGINIFNDTNIRDAMIVRSHDVIIRHIRFRTGHPPHNISPNGRNLMIGDIVGQNPVWNVIVDHGSFSWATDQPFDVSPANVPNTEPSPVSRVTVMNSMVYEGLRPHSKGPNFRSCGVSMIKSLIASNTIRNPNNTCGKWNVGGLRSGGGVTGETEFRNNVVYNGSDAFFDMWDGRGDAWANIVGNVFKKGPQSKGKLNNQMTHDIYPIDAWTFSDRQHDSGTCAQNGGTNCNPDADSLHIYMNDNIALPGANKTWPSNGIGGVLNPNDAHLLSPTPVGDGVFEDGLLGPAMPANQVFAHVLANAGAFPNNRDSADARIVTETQNGTGNIPFCTSSQGATVCDLAPALPTLAGGTNYPDADADGMDDGWEASNGVSSPTADADGDGWTNLEEFLHFRAATR